MCQDCGGALFFSTHIKIIKAKQIIQNSNVKISNVRNRKKQVIIKLKEKKRGGGGDLTLLNNPGS